MADIAPLNFNKDGKLLGEPPQLGPELTDLVRFLDSLGETHVKNASELEVHYRQVPSLEKNYAVSAVFQGRLAPRDEGP